MILFITDSGESLPIALRVKKEGTEAKAYIHNDAYKYNYDGIVDKVKIGVLRKTVQEAELVIFDTNRVNQKSKSDFALLKVFGLPKDSPVVFGAVADKLKSSCNTVGATTAIIDFKAAKKKVEGVEMYTEGWFDGKEFVFYNHVLENKTFLTGNLGLSLRSQTNLVWVDRKPLLEKNFKKIVPLLREAGYKGAIGINTVVSSKNKKPYFLDIVTGFKFDALYCLLSLIDGDITDFFKNGFNVKFKKEYAASERVTIPPFPYSEPSLLDLLAKDVVVDSNGSTTFWGQDIKRENGSTRVVGADGIVGTTATKGTTIKAAFSSVFRGIHRLKVDAPLQYRIDGTKEMEKRIEKLEKWGVK